MELTEEQKQALARWAKEGCGLSEIQRRLADEFELNVRFMDLRFLLLDLGIALADKAPAAETATLSETPPAPSAPEAEPLGQTPGPGAPGSARVSVTVDKLAQPGALVNGSVTFSDGTTARWALDQLGRLAIDAGQPGYRPGPDDVAAFQQELKTELQKRGF